jgi:hypothetical protein
MGFTLRGMIRGEKTGLTEPQWSGSERRGKERMQTGNRWSGIENNGEKQLEREPSIRVGAEGRWGETSRGKEE